jgi:hypothetical protein
MGNEEKYTKHSLMLSKQRLAIVKAKQENEEKFKIMVFIYYDYLTQFYLYFI